MPISIPRKPTVNRGFTYDIRVTFLILVLRTYLPSLKDYRSQSRDGDVDLLDLN